MSYALSEHLRLSGGKMRTPIGYWNNAYHHGQAISPTIDRPMLCRFEHDGGALPVHTTGVQLSGRDMGPAHLGFDMLVGNGLGNRPTTDTNSTPSVTAALHSQLTPSLRVWRLGLHASCGSGHPDPTEHAASRRHDQVITGGFVSYFAERLEGIAELQQVANRSAGITTSSPNWFVYGGVRVSPRLVPYVVHDELRLANDEPYVAAAQVRREIAGLRFEQTAAVVLKAELRSTDRPGLPRATVAGLQLAVAF